MRRSQQRFSVIKPLPSINDVIRPRFVETFYDSIRCVFRSLPFSQTGHLLIMHHIPPRGAVPCVPKIAPFILVAGCACCEVSTSINSNQNSTIWTSTTFPAETSTIKPHRILLCKKDIVEHLNRVAQRVRLYFRGLKPRCICSQTHSMHRR